MALLRQSFLFPSMKMVGFAAAIALVASAFPAMAGIRGSVHDFSDNAWSKGEICIVCHTPHNAIVGVQPLWNHTVTTSLFTMYSSPSMHVVAEQPGPGSTSRMCLSCHDGTIAVDSYGELVGAQHISGRPNLGTDLSNDHPIGIEWNHQTQSASTLGCMNCHDPLNLGGTPGRELRFFNRKIECASCHDVHNVMVMGPKLLRKTMVGSALCQHCHSK